MLMPLQKLRPPLLMVMGGPRQVATLLEKVEFPEITCYQMDLYQADRLRDELKDRHSPGQVVSGADLWDLPADFQTVVYPATQGSERSLKLDLVEQAFHVLRPRGTLLVLSPF